MIKSEDSDPHLAEKLLTADTTAIKYEEIHESKNETKQEDDAIQRAIALSLQDQNDYHGSSLGSSLHDGDTIGIKRELEGENSPQRAKQRRVDPAKQMKSPTKSSAKKDLGKAKSNKKITSFFTKS
jgi:hypothetical protein